MGEESRSQSKARETVTFDQMFHESQTSEIHGVSSHFMPFQSISYYFTTFHSIFASAKFCHVTLFPETWRPMFAGVVRSRGSYPAWVRGKNVDVGWGWDATGKWMTFKSCASCILDFLMGKNTGVKKTW